MRKISIFTALSFISAVATPALSFAAIDDDAPKVLLQSSCTEAGVALNNCFEDMNVLQGWVDNTRVRSVDAPLLVEIGPGRFMVNTFTCSDSGHITLRGAGRKHTIIQASAGYALTIVPECNINVAELTIEDTSSVSLGAVNVGSSIGGEPGKTTWTNVDINSKTYGWTEAACTGANHYWFGSRINVTTGFGIARGYSTCSTTWFYGSEITVRATETIAGGAAGEAVAIIAKGGGTELHFYGGNIRAISEMGVTLPPTEKASSPLAVKGLVGISAGPGDEVHIHGTGIDVISEEPNDIAAILGWNDSFVHASESAYAMKTGTGGKITRILKYGNADIRAPHQWHASTTPPDITSVDGSDLAVETDCSASGCQTVGSDPHLLLYKSGCTGAGGPWFDVVTGACR